MPPTTALRLLARPAKGVLTDQLVISARIRPRISRPADGVWRAGAPAIPSLCLRCSIRATVRFYSTEPKNPIPLQGDTIAASNTPNASPERTASTTSDANPAVPKSTHVPELPSSSEEKRSALNARFSTFMDNLQSRVLVASQRLNDLTGYSAIESIKASNAALETALATAQARLHDARAAYKHLTSTRASTQREVTTLLARKDSWLPQDLERFTTLYRRDHELEAQVAAASAELTEAEADEARLSAALNSGILKRYHEEQIWSDRIRRQSTWGTWGLMGINVLLFIMFQFVAEPWKRARLVKGVTEREKGVLEEVKRELGEVKAALAEAAQGRGPVATETAEQSLEVPAVTGSMDVAEVASPLPEPREPLSWKEFLGDPKKWQAAVLDLYSERKMDLRVRDATILALESAATGAAIAAGIAFTILRKST